MNEITIYPDTDVKDQRILIDTLFNFLSHIKSIKQKIFRSNGIISKLSSFLPFSALLNLYYSLINSHLLYSLPIWGSTYSTYLKKLCTLQNKAVRIINKGCYQDHVSSFYLSLKILKLTDLFKLEIAKIVYSHFQKNFFPYFLIFFSR